MSRLAGYVCSKQDNTGTIKTQVRNLRLKIELSKHNNDYVYSNFLEKDIGVLLPREKTGQKIFDPYHCYN